MFNPILGEVTLNMLYHLLNTPNTGVPINFTGTSTANYVTGSTFTQGGYYAFANVPGSVPMDRDHIIIYALELAMNQLSQGKPGGTQFAASGAQFPANYSPTDPTTWGYIPVNDVDFDAMDSFASPADIILTGGGVNKPNFGKAPSQNRSTYMQIINLTNPISGENVIAPGENGFIQYNPDGTGTVGPNFGDQVDLFSAFAYKPMDIK
jgi:hypothetical protein